MRGYVRNGAETIFGREHGLTEIKTYQQFAKRVPIRDYDELSPWIERIRRGEQGVLTTEPVRRLVPTSGSTAARKLIPYTDQSHREFNRAVGPWICDLYRRMPRAMFGPAYWSVTPVAQVAGDEDASVIPIGFDDDSAYLGGWFKHAVDAALAVPGEIKQISSVDVLRYVTLLLLLRRCDLSLISVWHPSFLELLLDVLPDELNRLAKDVANGGCAVDQYLPRSLHQLVHSKPNRTRAREIMGAGTGDATEFWPQLAAVSCWADGHAAPAAAALSKRLPGVVIQPKGLLATEGVVSIPFGVNQPLAIRSHFFEFVDEAGRVALASDLQRGGIYNVLLTTAGGLWRYRLNDLIQVTGTVGRTPTIRFVGKAGQMSDRVGEKLSEGFVSISVSRLFAKYPPQPSFALLAPDTDLAGCGYTLYVNDDPAPGLATGLDELLAANPHYNYCRKLGQLRAARVYRVGSGAYSAFCQRLQDQGKRLGNIKPVAAGPLDGWGKIFRGCFVGTGNESEMCAKRLHSATAR